MSFWLPMDSAPKDGTTIIGRYEDGPCLIFWSERPVCMLGPVQGGYPPGWAICGDGVDYNLPMDPPEAWKPEPTSPPSQPSGKGDLKGEKSKSKSNEELPLFNDRAETGKINL